MHPIGRTRADTTSTHSTRSSRGSVSRATGHDCNLPFNTMTRSCVDPRTGEPAVPHLIVMCDQCKTIWFAFDPTHADDFVSVFTGRDTSWCLRHWQELKPRTRLGRWFLARKAIPFDGDTAYLPPPLETISWANGDPRNLNGERVWQLSYPELVASSDGTGCAATRDLLEFHAWDAIFHTRPLECGLVDGHAGNHEAVGNGNRRYHW